jgi:ubiquinol-cytochrome c reductase cytochrome b subunit
MDLALTSLLIICIGLLAFFVPARLGPPANPADAQYIPRPEWYYLPIFQWLKYWHGSLSVIGVLVIPSVLALAVVALPFLDRGIERRPWKRPVAIVAYMFVLSALIGLGVQSRYSDRHDPAIGQQLAKQDQQEAEYMRKPFEPELSSSSLAAVNVTLSDPLAAKGKSVFESQSCSACHGDGGSGTAAAPALIAVGRKFDSQKLEEILKQPTAAMQQGGMTPLDLKADELKALIQYLQSLK